MDNNNAYILLETNFLTDEQYNNIITQQVSKNDILDQLGIHTKINYITIPRSLIRLTIALDEYEKSSNNQNNNYSYMNKILGGLMNN